ncbi:MULTISPECIES: TlpA disulfide reductase family protein [unclassified Bradyrhizobium]|jgi:thiol-disulfide isomerase/thioredoxin|uniref:TlpA family protein disulfide reductase n=1 Tax=unclassified Bradyrhizobium TaxID=2631580 RepID=UPI0007C842BD|nr:MULTISPECIES: TlpA disulfide reductase family protein [unclassified Bradyrhizobium]
MIRTKKTILQLVRVRLAAALVAAAWTTVAMAQDGKTFVMHAAPKPIASIQFEDAQGKVRSLADFHGKVVLLNVWATWCIPCRKEMPALDRLQALFEPRDFEVVPLSIDRGMDVVRKFYAEVGIQKLGLYRDTSGNATRELGTVGIPTTLLIDREGHEIGRLIGPAEWDAPQMVAFIRCVTSGGAATLSQAEAKPTTSTCQT